ncbi:MAG: hypothetical protein M2R45_05335 [Verrucomicrobia subdivision 3 bacterium]|nr:hypothetical protein [Limisphaerales bacterium]MCS1414946.1 hypothetical protein [Limisphaerales bacterium]
MWFLRCGLVKELVELDGCGIVASLEAIDDLGECSAFFRVALLDEFLFARTNSVSQFELYHRYS